MQLSTLEEWLDWISTVHTTEIELGLERIKRVAAKLGVLKPACPVVIVGGTNGKGSTVKGLEAIYRAAGFHVGAFTSPILFKHNEQVRIDGVLAKDAEFCDAYEKVESAREQVPLTPFEFHTLAALVIFRTHLLDVLILEVGLGGRLDAVNIIDADVSVVTSVAIDHAEWLGNTREAIGFEKAGIFRSQKPAVCGDPLPPESLVNYANEIGAPLYCQGKEFQYLEQQFNWSWVFQNIQYDSLPLTRLALQNMSTVLMVVTLLQDRLQVVREFIDKGLAEVKLPGRIEIINEPVVKIFDVSHNPAAITMLANQLNKMTCYGKTFAVFSMLADKDILESIKIIKPLIDVWTVAPLNTKRAASLENLKNCFAQADIQNVSFLSSIEEAYDMARLKCDIGDRIVVFGSFHTVAEAKSTTQP